MELRINLIPEYRKEEIRKSERLKLVWRLGLVFSLMAAAFFAVLFFFGLALDLNLKTVSDDAEIKNNEEKYQLINKYDSEFESVNNQVSDIMKIAGDQLYWSRMLENISQEIVPGVTVEKIATENFLVYLSGTANNRDNLILFKERLEKNGCFSKTDLPLSNLVAKENIAFQLDLEVKIECVRPSSN